MTWIDDYKGEGPWDLEKDILWNGADNQDLGEWSFTEQQNKFGYLNNPRWSAEQDAQDFCDDVGIALDPTDTHKPCGHWHKYPAGRTGIYVVELGLFSTGDNTNGQLGHDDTVDRSYFTRVGTKNDWIFVSTGADCSFGIDFSGRLWAWGENNRGQLGLGHMDNVLVPTQVGTGTNWVSVQGGSNHTIALKSNGTLWAAGRNSWGQLGVGVAYPNDWGVDYDEFVQVGTDTDWASIAVDGDDCSHSLAIKEDGTLWTWGKNNVGQLGLGYTSAGEGTPLQVGTDVWLLVARGEAHTMGIKSGGTLWGTGDNGDGQLGLGYTGSSPDEFTQVGADTNWVYVSAGEFFTYAIKSNSTVWATGENDDGQLGQGDKVSLDQFTQVGVAVDWEFIETGQSGTHVALINSSRELWVVGFNYDGQLGLGDFGLGTERTSLVQVTVPTLLTGWFATSCGVRHSLALKSLAGDVVAEDDVGVELDEPQVWPMD